MIEKLLLLNALNPIVVTLVPMVTVVRLVQPENAYIPILVTLLGMVMLVREVQAPNAKNPMLVTLEVGVNVTLARLEQP